MRVELGCITITNESTHGTSELAIIDLAPSGCSILTITFHKRKFVRIEIGKGNKFRNLVVIENKERGASEEMARVV